MADDTHGPVEGDVYMANEPNADRMEDNSVPVVIDGALIGGLTRAEIDVQISTAHRFRRVVTAVKRMIETLATLDQETAEGCFFRLERKKWDPKTRQETVTFIEGPSIRFAEIVLAAYGNARVASRRTDLTDVDVEATGIFHDLESNVAWAKSVRRSIMTSPKKGDPKRFSADMINVTTNAAASIALRNAILAGVPRGYWKPGYDKAMAAARGTADTLIMRRQRLVLAFKDAGVDQAQVFEVLGIRGLDDITLDLMFDATGLLNALRDGEVTVDELLAERRQSAAAPTLDDALKPGAAKRQADAPKPAPAKPAPDKPADDSGNVQGSAAQSAEPDKGTKDSATAASTGSAAAPSGQQEPSPKSDDGSKPAEQGAAAAEVIEFPGDRKPDAIDTQQDRRDGGEGQEETASGDDSEGAEAQRGEADAALTAEEIEHFNRYAGAVKGADSWAKIKPSVEWLIRQPFFAKAPAETAEGVLTLAYQKAVELNEPLFADQKVKPESDPLFFRLYLRSKPIRAEMDAAFRVLIRAKSFTDLPEAEQNVILDEYEEAKK